MVRLSKDVSDLFRQYTPSSNQGLTVSAETLLTELNSICGSSVCDPTIVRSLRLSFDEGRNWDKYSFTSSPLYVDGVLGEPGEDTLIMT